MAFYKTFLTHSWALCMPTWIIFAYEMIQSIRLVTYLVACQLWRETCANVDCVFGIGLILYIFCCPVPDRESLSINERSSQLWCYLFWEVCQNCRECAFDWVVIVDTSTFFCKAKPANPIFEYSILWWNRNSDISLWILTLKLYSHLRKCYVDVFTY